MEAAGEHRPGGARHERRRTARAAFGRCGVAAAADRGRNLPVIAIDGKARDPHQ